MSPLRSLAVAAALASTASLATSVGTPADAVTTYAVNGRVVDVVTGHAVSCARVTVRSAEDVSHVIGSGHTGTYGYFRVGGLPASDGYAVRVDATSCGYGAGYVTGTRRISSWGNAVAWGPGNLGTVRIRHH